MWNILLAAAFVGFLPRILLEAGKYLFPGVIFQTQPQRKIVALTIDDAPYSQHSTKAIIEALRRHESAATFFVITDLVDNAEQVLVEAINEGHELANHGKTNSIHAFKGKKELNVEVDSCSRTLAGLYSKSEKQMSDQKFYRPGGGLLSTPILELCPKFQIVLGSAYPFDPILRWPLLNFYILKWFTAPGDIIILHDREWTPALLDLYLPWLNDNGYECVTLSNLIASPPSGMGIIE